MVTNLELLSFGMVSFFESWRRRLVQEEVLACQEQHWLWSLRLISWESVFVSFADYLNSRNFKGKLEINASSKLCS